MEDHKENEHAQEATSDRRELMQKLGRFAAYAAPFTVLALTTEAATASGPKKGGSTLKQH
jgi:hypothetical protein